MVTKAVQTLCQEIESRNYQLNEQLAIGSALNLGSLYYHLQKKKKNDKELLSRTIGLVKKNLTQERVQIIWDEINSKDNDNCKEEEGVKMSLHALKKEMLQDVFYFRLLTPESLIRVGSNPQWYRYVLVALTRNHVLASEGADPFENYNYGVLEEHKSSDSNTILNPFKRCQTFPVEEIYQLGKDNLNIAQLIMNDLTDTLGYFKVSARFAEDNEVLRPWITQNWSKHLKRSISSKTREFLTEALPRLKQKYEEFKDVNLESIEIRNSATLRPEEPKKPSDEEKSAVEAGIGGGVLGTLYSFWNMYQLPTTMVLQFNEAAQIAQVMRTAVSIAPVVVPNPFVSALTGFGLGYAGYSGINYLYKQYICPSEVVENPQTTEETTSNRLR